MEKSFFNYDNGLKYTDRMIHGEDEDGKKVNNDEIETVDWFKRFYEKIDRNLNGEILK